MNLSLLNSRWQTAQGNQPTAQRCARATAQRCTARRHISCRSLSSRSGSGSWSRDDDEDDDDLPSISPAARRLLQTDKFPTGSEYGEGFIQYNIGREPVHLSVDMMNEKLKHQGAARHRHVNRPDEQFGLIFNFDGVVAPIRAAYVRAWAALAQAKGIPVALSRHQQHALGLRSTTPERAMIDILGWTRDIKVARQTSWELAELYAEELKKISEPLPGLREWLVVLGNYNVPCALVSSLDRPTVMRMLERMGLHDYFNVMVTAEADMEALSQRLLAASLQLHRPPNLCVAFEDSPPGITAAHNCTMKAVAVCSAYPAYQLKQADLTCSTLNELAVYNLRRLFANQGHEFMDLKQSSSGNKTGNRRRTRNAMEDPGERP